MTLPSLTNDDLSQDEENLIHAVTERVTKALAPRLIQLVNDSISNARRPGCTSASGRLSPFRNDSRASSCRGDSPRLENKSYTPTTLPHFECQSPRLLPGSRQQLHTPAKRDSILPVGMPDGASPLPAGRPVFSRGRNCFPSLHRTSYEREAIRLNQMCERSQEDKATSTTRSDYCHPSLQTRRTLTPAPAKSMVNLPRLRTQGTPQFLRNRRADFANEGTAHKEPVYMAGHRHHVDIYTPEVSLPGSRVRWPLPGDHLPVKSESECRHFSRLEPLRPRTGYPRLGRRPPLPLRARPPFKP